MHLPDGIKTPHVLCYNTAATNKEATNMQAFDRIIGYAEIKNELKQIADVLRNTELYKNFGVKAPQGLLLYGEPGVGKTLMADCLIEASGRSVVVCRKNEPNGDFIKKICTSFQNAVEQAPSIILLDDMDKFSNADERHRDAEEYVTVQSCIDEIKDSDVFVLATVNDTRRLPHSLLRAGRFDRKIRIDRPCDKDALEIIRHNMQSIGIPTDVPIEFIARLLWGSSCAKLETILNDAGICACFERSKKITLTHILDAFLRRHTQTAADEQTDDSYSSYQEEMRRQICMHEAGHAAVSELLDPGSVTLTCISVPACVESGGAVISYHPNTAATPEQQLRRIKINLAGVAANEMLRGCKDAGGYMDLKNAYAETENYISINGVFGFSLYDNGCNKSECFKQNQEAVVAAEMERLHSEVKNMIVHNRAFVQAIADQLYEKTYVTMYDIAQIRAEVSCVPTA